MTYNPNFSNFIRTTSQQVATPRSTEERLEGRVVDVILDENHPDYETEGRQLALNGIRYEPINFSLERTEEENYPFAYCLNTSIKDIPEVDEIIEIVPAASDSNDIGGIGSKTYYRGIVNIWNNPNHNARPDKITSNDVAILGSDVVENSEISNLTAFPGDLILEGRHGNTLRFGGNNSDRNPYTDNSNNGKPFSIFRVGVRTNDDKFFSHIEDVEKDYSSIYLMSEHSIPSARTPNTKQDTYKENDKPGGINSYIGSQILINSGRLVFTSDQDHILLNSIKSIGISSNSFNVDSSEYVTVDSPRISLGVRASEAVVRGEKLEELIELILDMLGVLGANLKSSTSPTQANILLPIAGEVILNYKDILKDRLPSIKSKKVFTE